MGNDRESTSVFVAFKDHLRQLPIIFQPLQLKQSMKVSSSLKQQKKYYWPYTNHSTPASRVRGNIKAVLSIHGIERSLKSNNSVLQYTWRPFPDFSTIIIIKSPLWEPPNYTGLKIFVFHHAWRPQIFCPVKISTPLYGNWYSVYWLTQTTHVIYGRIWRFGCWHIPFMHAWLIYFGPYSTDNLTDQRVNCWEKWYSCGSSHHRDKWNQCGCNDSRWHCASSLLYRRGCTCHESLYYNPKHRMQPELYRMVL